MKITRFSLLCFAACSIVFISCSHAFNFGSVLKNGYSEVYEGKAAFQILLWTSDSESVDVRLFAEEIPVGWKLDIQKPNLSISKAIGDEIVVSGGEYIRASVVKILAYPPSDEEPGEYQIRIRASAYRGSSEMHSNQERVFSLMASLKEMQANGNGSLPDASAFIIAGAIIILAALTTLRFLK